MSLMTFVTTEVSETQDPMNVNTVDEFSFLDTDLKWKRDRDKVLSSHRSDKATVLDNL